VDGPAAAEVAVRTLEAWLRLKPRDDGARALLAAAWARRAPAAAPGEPGLVRFLWHQPRDGQHAITNYYVEAFSRARARILAHANFANPVEPLRTALSLAAARGVRVVLITNSERANRRAIDPSFAGWLRYHFLSRPNYRRLRGTGIEVREVDVFTHSKALVVDAAVASVGSYNFSASSVEDNTEGTLILHDPAAVAEVEAMLLEDLDRSRRVQ
jgi:cardiolipin synthase